MPIFVMFVFGSIALGAGAMMAPALPTHGPRVGLAAAFALALVVSGGVFNAALVGWSTLVIDYLWFALLVGIFLAGTLSAGMFRTEAKGGIKEYGGWPGPRELAFFLTAAIIFAAPALLLPVPLDTDAQGFGYLALALRNSGSLTTLAPFHPEITYLYSPGVPMLVAYLGTQLHAGLQNIELALGAVLCLVFVWVAYDFGNELDSESGHDAGRRTGIVFAVCALIGTGLLTAELDSHYTALLGLVFAFAFLTFVLRFYREGKRLDFFAAAVTLAGVVLAQPDMTIVLALGFGPWLLTMWLASPRPTLRRWVALAFGIPSLALIGLTPWLNKIAPMLGNGPVSPFQISLEHLLTMITYHGVVIVVLSLVGIAVAVRRRNVVDLLMLPWLILLIDFSSLGILKTLVPWLVAPLTRYSYPFSLAWHGPIIAYIYFGGTGTLAISKRLGEERVLRWARTISLPLMNVVALIVVLAMLFADPLLAASKSLPFHPFGAFSSRADVQAMEWLQQNTPSDAVILNYPGENEGYWAPIVAQRNAIYFRPQPFFRGTQVWDTAQADLLAFWQHPSDSASADLLTRYHISYVLVPQIVTRPESLKLMFRWRLPLPEALAYKSFGDIPYLKRVFESDGAEVYQVVQQ